MFAGCLETSLKLPIADRHEFVGEVVGMIETILKKCATSVEKRFEELNSTVTELEKEKARRVEAAEKAKEELAILTTELASAEIAKKESAVTEKEKHSILQQKKLAFKTIDATLAKTVKDHTAISNFHAALFTEQTEEKTLGHFKTLFKQLKAGTTMVFETGLGTSAPNSFAKKSENRTEFDKLVVEQVQKVVQEKLATLSLTIETPEKEKAAVFSDLQEAEEQYKVSVASHAEAKEKLKCAQDAKTQGANALQDKEELVESFESEALSSVREAADAKREIARFEILLSEFLELKEFGAAGKPVPVEAEAEAEAAVEAEAEEEAAVEAEAEAAIEAEAESEANAEDAEMKDSAATVVGEETKAANNETATTTAVADEATTTTTTTVDVAVGKEVPSEKSPAKSAGDVGVLEANVVDVIAA